MSYDNHGYIAIGFTVLIVSRGLFVCWLLSVWPWKRKHV